MSFSGTSTRYPDFKVEDIKNEKELSKKLSELTRAIDDRDKQTLHPFDIYGRTLTINSSNLVYDGESGGFKVYTLTVPRDVGTVYINYPGIDAAERIIIYLPESSSVEGRTITFVMQRPGSLPSSYSFSVAVAPGSGNQFAAIPDKTYPVAGTISITSTSTAPSITGTLSVSPSGDVYLPIFIATSSTLGGQLYVTSGGLLTTTPQATFPLAKVPAGALPVGGTLTVGAPTITNTVSATLQAEILGSPQNLGWTFQIRAYFNKWLIVSRD